MPMLLDIFFGEFQSVSTGVTYTVLKKIEMSFEQAGSAAKTEHTKPIYETADGTALVEVEIGNKHKLKTIDGDLLVRVRLNRMLSE